MVGGGAGPVQLHNLAAGTAATDAVNVGQLDSAIDSAVSLANHYTDARLTALDFDLKRSRQEARSGTAAALAAAGLPQPFGPGKRMIAAAAGTYRGRAAFALGASATSGNGKAVMKLGVTYDSSSHVGTNLGLGWQF